MLPDITLDKKALSEFLLPSQGRIDRGQFISRWVVSLVLQASEQSVLCIQFESWLFFNDFLINEAFSDKIK